MSAPEKPPRRFKPDLVEHTSTSSKKSRRFAPEPISTTTRSHRNQETETSNAPSATPDDNDPGAEVTPSQPIPDQNPPTETPKPRRKFAVEPIETTTKNNRNQGSSPEESGASSIPSNDKAQTAQQTEHKPARRRFAPQLIETATRSRKAGDTLPAVLPSDKTNASPGDPVKKERPPVKPIPPSNTPAASTNEVPQFKPAPARQGSIRAHPNTRANSRYHSVRVPSLPDIESSGSDESRPRSRSRSHGEESDTSNEGYKDATRMRESLDENFSGYLLALAARAAEKQLREQEVAVFANQDLHEPVAHYVNRSDSEGEVSEPKVGRYGQVAGQHRDSGDERAAMQELRTHGEKVFEQQKRKQRTAGFDIEFGEAPSKQDIWTTTKAGPFTNPAKTPKNVIGGHRQCPELKQMRKAASPPMLGGDIGFPRCASPEHARFDVTQGADYLRKNVCYLSEQSSQQQGLWGKPGANRSGAGDGQKQDDDKAKSKSKGQGQGLWGGFCKQEDQKAVKTPAGLVTPMRTPIASPRNERADPMSSLLARAVASDPNSLPRSPGRAPPSPPAETSHDKDGKSGILQSTSFAVLDWKLEMEARLEEEFNDAFVTQIYNYLSFGYPALGRKYDDELARVTKIPLDELREDDDLAEAKGYVRLGQDEVGRGADGVDETSCKRWRALRRYVKEWGKQMMIRERENDNQPWGTGGHDPHRAWGLPARRGSWGI